MGPPPWHCSDRRMLVKSMPLLRLFLAPFSSEQAIWVAVLAVSRKCSGVLRANKETGMFSCPGTLWSSRAFQASMFCSSGCQVLPLFYSVPNSLPTRATPQVHPALLCPNANTGIKMNFLLSRKTRLAFSAFQHATCVTSLEALPRWWHSAGTGSPPILKASEDGGLCILLSNLGFILAEIYLKCPSLVKILKLVSEKFHCPILSPKLWILKINQQRGFSSLSRQ